MLRRPFAVLALVLAPWGLTACRGGFEGQIGAADRAVFAAPDEVEILALDPGNGTGHGAFPPGVDAFHGFRVRGRAALRDPAELLDLVRRGIDRADDRVAACFLPRHGLVLRRGERRLDLVLCYECFQIRLYRDGGSERVEVRTHDSVAPAVSAIFREHGLSIAPR